MLPGQGLSLVLGACVPNVSIVRCDSPAEGAHKENDDAELQFITVRTSNFVCLCILRIPRPIFLQTPSDQAALVAAFMRRAARIACAWTAVRLSGQCQTKSRRNPVAYPAYRSPTGQ